MISGKVKKEIRDWVIFIVLIGFLYATGLYKEVAGFAQRMILITGIIQPEVQQDNYEVLNDFDITLKSLETGKHHNFAEFRGQLIFLNLWATWCPPCRAEMPSIQSLYDEYKDRDIVFVMLSSDEEFNKIRKYVDRKEFSFPVYQLASPLPEALYSGSIPTTYVIDQDGKILMKNSGMANYNTTKFKKFIESHL
jgi:thiol-disulfide isomerase/thioredoxin